MFNAELTSKRSLQQGPRSQGVWEGGGGDGGGRGRLYSTLHCHHLNDFSIQMGSDEEVLTAGTQITGGWREERN